MLVLRRLLDALLLVVAKFLQVQLIRFEGDSLARIRHEVLLKLRFVDTPPRRQLTRLWQPHRIEALSPHLVKYFLRNLVANRRIVSRQNLLLFNLLLLRHIRNVNQSLVAKDRLIQI